MLGMCNLSSKLKTLSNKKESTTYYCQKQIANTYTSTLEHTSPYKLYKLHTIQICTFSIRPHKLYQHKHTQIIHPHKPHTIDVPTVSTYPKMASYVSALIHKMDTFHLFCVFPLFQLVLGLYHCYLIGWGFDLGDVFSFSVLPFFTVYLIQYGCIRREVMTINCNCNLILILCSQSISTPI